MVDMECFKCFRKHLHWGFNTREHSFQSSFLFRLHAAQGRNKMTLRRLKDSSTVKVLNASLGGGRPIRVRPELEDGADGFLLKDERVEGRAVEEGLHLETLQVPKPNCRAFAQQLHRPGGVRLSTCSSSQVFNFTWKVTTLNDLSEQEGESRAEGRGQVVRKTSDLVQHGAVVRLSRNWKLGKNEGANNHQSPMQTRSQPNRV